MARFFQEEAPNVIQGQRILELASGTGILGLQLGVMGAQQVLMTDKASMTQLLEGNIVQNEALFARGESATAPVMHAASLDWLEATADPAVLAAAPFDVIIMSDVIYEEEIVLPLIHTLRRLCHLNLEKRAQALQDSLREGRQRDGARDARCELDPALPSGDSISSPLRPPPIYMCASHRAERVEDIFFSELDQWFICEELTNTPNPVLRRLLNKDAIAIWVLTARETQLGHLVDDIGALRSSFGDECEDAEQECVGLGGGDEEESSRMADVREKEILRRRGADVREEEIQRRRGRADVTADAVNDDRRRVEGEPRCADTTAASSHTCVSAVDPTAVMGQQEIDLEELD